MNKLLVVALASSLTFSAFAVELTTAQQRALNAKLAPLAKEMQGGDVMAAMNLMPPKFFEYMSEQAGISAKELKKRMNEQAKAVMAMVEVESYEYDLSNAMAEQSSSGRNYVFIPASSKMKMGEQVLKQDGYMLALEDKGQWYLINWEDRYTPIIEGMYPDMKGIKAPE